MIDEKILLQELKTEYQKTLSLYGKSGNLLFAAELTALDNAIKIVKSQKKIRKAHSVHDVVVEEKKKCIPRSLLDEWEKVTKDLRRCYK